jgi:hypothetical protein
MPDANEEIVRRYLELDGYFVRSRVQYKYTTPGGGAGWSDVDLCGITSDGQAIAVEVKGWHTEKITASYIKDWPTMFHFSVRLEATQALTHVLGTAAYRKVLVIGQLGSAGGQPFGVPIDQQAAVAFQDHATSLGIEVLTFPTILERLVAETELGPDAATEGEHMIRLLKRYGFVT